MQTKKPQPTVSNVKGSKALLHDSAPAGTNTQGICCGPEQGSYVSVIPSHSTSWNPGYDRVQLRKAECKLMPLSALFRAPSRQPAAAPPCTRGAGCCWDKLQQTRARLAAPEHKAVTKEPDSSGRSKLSFLEGFILKQLLLKKKSPLTHE